MVERFPKRVANEGEAKQRITEGFDQLSPAERLAYTRKAQESIHAEIAIKKEEIAHVDAKLERTRELLALPEDESTRERGLASLETERETFAIEIADLEYRLEHLGESSMNTPPKQTLN